ncbi:hypothetical protein FHE72_01095 [Rossellomorea vietnamensis]|uniref:Uncharacterized protein n=1 Tax=Rossellomorea vietnamensis TaxID=218284 RepID=A0A6I6UJW5_9BACI|nr:hypothetical protein [Rossellomorea vietnamensis]QHE59789.1 hypothetical protein FHE72_01095 [Rossellomorea vietnamensis]
MALMNGYSKESLVNVLNNKYEIKLDIKVIEKLLSDWLRDGLIFYDSESYVSLAIEASAHIVTQMEEGLEVVKC